MLIRKSYKFFILFLLVFLFILTSCKKQDLKTPSYLGMVVNSENTSASLTNDSLIEIKDPFNRFDERTIVDEIKKEIKDEEIEVMDCYTKVDKDLFITVKLFNPSNLKILSIKINDQKFNNYEFQKDSDNENIIIKINSGNTAGIQEFVLNEILYYNENKIEQIPITEKNKVKVGISYDKEPAIKVQDFIINANSISLDIMLSDYENVITKTSSFIKAVLYDGETIISSKVLTQGNNKINFKNLKTSTLYQYAIYSYCDILDGNKKQLKILDVRDFYTANIFEIDYLEVSSNSLNFNIKINDADQLGHIKSIKLYKDNIFEKEISNSENYIISDLTSDSLYKIKVIYEYTFNDETYTKEEEIEIKTLKANPIVTIINKEINFESYVYELDIIDKDNSGELVKIDLYKNDILVKENLSLDNYNIDNLYSNTEYNLKLYYKYKLDGINDEEIIVEHKFKTLSKMIPEINVNVFDIMNNSFKFTVDEEDVNNVGEIKGIKLYHNNIEVANLVDLSIREFTNLLSNNNYTLKFAYSYDLNDNEGEKIIEKLVDVTLLEKEKPSIEFLDVTSTSTEIKFNYSVNDIDNVGYISIINLYKNGILVSSLETFNNLIFSDLNVNDQYLLEIKYCYDLNDGNGKQEIITTYEQFTLAEEITISKFTLLNNTTPKVNEEIHARITFNNPSNVQINGFILNGELINVVKLNETANSNETLAIIKFTPQFDGGVYKFTINEFIYNNYGNTLKQNVSTLFEDEFLILGNIYGLKLYNEKDNMIGLLDDDSYLFIDLYNPTNYNIYNLTIKIKNQLFEYSYDKIEVVNNNCIKILWPKEINKFEYPFMDITVESIVYGIEQKNVTKKEIDITNNFIILNSLTIRDIFTYEDLINLENGYHYSLRNNIDLGDYPWKPFDFKGIIYGNGYEIQNISIVYKNEILDTYYYGLFGKFDGIIKNLSLPQMYVSIKANGTVFYGGIAGEVERAILENNYVSGNIYIQASDIVCAGGIIGSCFNSEISKNIFDGQFFIKAEETVISGGIGIADNSKASCNISRVKIVLDLFGQCKINTFIGSFTNSPQYDNYMTYDSDILINDINLIKTNYFTLLTEENIANKDFYLNTLKWDNLIWNLDLIQNNKLPILRKI